MVKQTIENNDAMALCETAEMVVSRFKFRCDAHRDDALQTAFEHMWTMQAAGTKDLRILANNATSVVGRMLKREKRGGITVRGGLATGETKHEGKGRARDKVGTFSESTENGEGEGFSIYSITPERNPNPEEALLAKERILRLRGIFYGDEVSERDQCIFAALLDDCTMAEAGKLGGISKQAVDKKIDRLRRNVRIREIAFEKALAFEDAAEW